WDLPMLPSPTTSTLTFSGIQTSLEFFFSAGAGGAAPEFPGSSGLHGLVEEVRLVFLDVAGGHLLPQLEGFGIRLHLLSIEVVGLGDELVGHVVLCLDGRRNLSQAVDGVEEGLPGRDVVVPPASTLFHVAAIDIDLLENGGDPQFGAKVAGQRGELFEDTFHS